MRIIKNVGGCGCGGDCGCGGGLKGYEFGKASWGKRTFSDVKGLIGTVAIFESCTGGDVLFRIDKLEYVRGLDNFLFTSRLAGKVIWGTDDFDTIDIDHRALAKKQGWKPVTTLTEVLMGTPYSEEQLYLDKVELSTVEANGLSFAAFTGFEGADLISNMDISWSSKKTKEKKPVCVSIKRYKCSPIFCQETCDRIIKNRRLVDCDCPQSFVENPLGSCWHGVWSRCENVGCRWPKRCRRGWPHRCTCA